ncbi:hypothetical protein V8F20_000517 [Naviculisporaceae sp. PSN 640]
MLGSRHHHTTTTTHTVTPRRRGIFSRRAHAPVTGHHTTVPVTTHRKKRAGLFSRRSPRQTHHTTATPVAPVHHHKRKTTMGDKISGALLRIKGSLTGRPGQKAAGTRRMHGTDGRGSRRTVGRRRFF